MFLRLVTTALVALALPAGVADAAVPQRAMPGGTRVLMISNEGGFVAPGYIKSALPTLVAYANGTVLVPAQDVRRPDVREIRLHRLSPGELRALVGTIAKFAVTPPKGWGIPGVADVPNTHVQIDLPGVKRDVSVFALSFSNGVTPRQAAARRALAKSIAALQRAVAATPAAAWRPDTYEAWASTPIMNAVGDAAQASVFCVSMDGTIANGDLAKPDVCIRPDGGREKAWDYFLTASKSFAAWPANVEPPVSACTSVGARAFNALLRGNNDSGRWILPSGQAAVFVFRPMLPGERACHRT